MLQLIANVAKIGVSMGTITKRKTKDGKSIRYTATVRVQRQGLPNFTKSKTFSTQALAKEWIKKLEAEIEVNPDIIAKPAQSKYGDTLKEFLQHYSDEVGDQFNPKYKTNLARVAEYDISKHNVFTLTKNDFSQHAMARRRGDVMHMKEGVSPSTAKQDFDIFSSVLRHAFLVWGVDVKNTQSELEQAKHGLMKARIISKSKQVDRLATAEELQLLTNFFYQEWMRGRGTIPMHLIMWLAIYTGRRQDEICNLRLSDFDRLNSQWLIRDVKNPDGSKGNHKYAHLEPNALLLIDEFLKPEIRNRMSILGYSDELLVPMNTRTISSYFTRACKVCGIDGLRFHDLRHEAATRYAEDGFTIPQLQTITLHSSWASLQRYTNLKKRGERLDFTEAMEFADSQYNQHNTPTERPKHNPLNKVEVAKTKQAMQLARHSDKVTTNLPFLQSQIDEFMAQFKPSKRVTDDLWQQVGLDNVFAWDNARQRFIADYTQEAWEKWFIENGKLDWQDSPSDATHFDYHTLDLLKIENNEVAKWAGVWVDITPYYDLSNNKLIIKD